MPGRRVCDPPAVVKVVRPSGRLFDKRNVKTTLRPDSVFGQQWIEQFPSEEVYGSLETAHLIYC